MKTKLSQVPFCITDPEVIPTQRYHDAAFFELEKEKLWPHMWQMACRIEEIPEVGDYTNLPIQQLGLRDIDVMRLSREEEGIISNYQRLIDGYLAGVDRDALTRAGQIVNCGFQTPIHNLGF